MWRKSNIRRREAADITSCSSEGLLKGKCVTSCIFIGVTYTFFGAKGR